MPNGIVLVREYAMQYRDGLITAHEMLAKITVHLANVSEHVQKAELETNKYQHDFADELSSQLLKD